MSSSVSKQNPRQRSSIMTRSRTKKKSSCVTCARIMAIFKLRHPTRTISSINLGSCEEVIEASSCEVHPKLLLSYFGYTSFKNHNVKSFECNFNLKLGLAEFWMLTSKGRRGIQQYLGLLPNTALSAYQAGRKIDAQWIENGLLRRWKQTCGTKHGSKCSAVVQRRISGEAPKFLVDTWLLCLVKGFEEASYIALSYVWGLEVFFKTLSSDLTSLQVKDAFLDTQKRKLLPQTILDAIAITQVLGERYLWVDALCIVQDDNEMKQQEINNMGFIYANASITIIACQGTNANYGLRGVRGASSPRSTSQILFRLDQHHTFVKPWVPSLASRFWHHRGWTFQEALFSRRTLSFDDGRVWWNCNSATFEEDFKPLPGYARRLRYGWDSSTFPNEISRKTLSVPLHDLPGFWFLVSTYNQKELTNPEDAQAAFAGITTVLSSGFNHGFLCGIPVLYLDLLLCWQPILTCRRRVPRQSSLSAKHSLPSWSWLGWRGPLAEWNFTLEYYHRFQDILHGRDKLRVTIPRVQWFSRAYDSDTVHQISAPHLLYKMQSEAQNDHFNVPRGWERIRFPERSPNPELDLFAFGDDYQNKIVLQYYYKHELDPSREFWYPLPINQSLASESACRQDSLLCCRTLRVVLYLGKAIHRPWNITHEAGHHHRLHDKSGKWAGAIQLHDKLEIDAASNDPNKIDAPADPETCAIPCELVMISEGYIIEGPGDGGMSEWRLEERPRRPDGEKYEYYNVLWVEWEDGIAYRKGCGRVMKSIWEALNPEDIDLTLG